MRGIQRCPRSRRIGSRLFPMYLEGSCPIPWRWRMPLERLAMALPVAEDPFASIEGVPGPAPLTIAAAGDLSMERMPSYDSATILNDAFAFWDSADIRVANLESQCTDRVRPAIPAKGMRAPGEAATFVAAARIDAVTVANNHALDFGSDAFQESRQRVEDLGVGVTGFVEQGENCARPYLMERNGLRLGMLAWCDHYRPPEQEPIAARPATLPAEPAMLDAVRELRSRADIVLVQLHWGYEFALHPLLRHRDLARRVADAGAQVVLCHHAHVPMALELHGQSVIAHGLGNWIFSDRPYFRDSHDWTFQSFLLKVGVGPEGVHRAEVEPFTLGPDSRIHRMPEAARAKFLAQLGRLNRRVGDDAWLRRAQDCRTIYESVNTVAHLDKASPVLVRERARTLGIPSGAALIAGLRELKCPSATGIADWFEALATAAGDPGELDRAWSLGRQAAKRNAVDLTKRQRWTDAFRARIP
jgi:poly-gamma-glutamate capsule biosynthesis protein CapA/YwtB (metallophosphatase superfamily)